MNVNSISISIQIISELIKENFKDIIYAPRRQIDEIVMMKIKAYEIERSLCVDMSMDGLGMGLMNLWNMIIILVKEK